MSLIVSRKSFPPSELMVYAESEPLSIDLVQKTLHGLWREASGQNRETEASSQSRETEPSGESRETGGNSLPLACLWNLIAFHANPSRIPRDSGGEANRIQSLLEEVTVSLPARVIHLEEWPDSQAPESGKEVEARVSTNCLHSPGGQPLVCCEEINLAGYGRKGHSHFPALVRAFLVPDLPVALVWLDDIPREGKLLGQLLGMCSRVVIDNQHTSDTASLLAANDMLKASPGKLVDLSWLRLSPLRHLLADFFDAPGQAGQLQRIESIHIETSPAGRNPGRLMMGWLISACGYGQPEAVDQDPSQDTLRWTVRRSEPGQGPASEGGEGGNHSFPLDFSMRDGYGGLDGIFSITLRAGGETYSLRDTDPEHMAVKGPHLELPNVHLREMDDPGLMVAALGGGPPDQVYGKALAMAALLAETEQRNQ